MNLYYKEDKTTRPSTIALYVLFILVIMLAVAKVAVYDLVEKFEDEKAKLAENQALLAAQTEYLADYKEVSSKYSRYSYSYLTAEERLCNRIDILDMLEETVFAKTTTDSVVISDDVVSLNFKGLNLEDTAKLVATLEKYEIVESVAVNTSSLNDSEEEGSNAIATRMVITLVSEEAGGNQDE